MKTLATFAFLFIVTGCAAQQTTVDLTKYHNDTYIECIDHRDGSSLDYLKSQQKDVKSTIFPDFTISQIVDINGKHVQINQSEWTNFTCTSVPLK